jgi:hypothetical protein
MSIDGLLKDFKCNGANLSPDVKKRLQSLGPGSKFYIENIKVMVPDGTVRKLSTVTIKII